MRSLPARGEGRSDRTRLNQLKRCARNRSGHAILVLSAFLLPDLEDSASDLQRVTHHQSGKILVGVAGDRRHRGLCCVIHQMRVVQADTDAPIA